MAYSVIAGLLAIILIAAPYADRPLAHVTSFIPVYATVLAIINLLIAMLVLAQFWVVRWTWLLVLSCGFLFTGLSVVFYALTFPEAFAPSGLLGAGPQSAAWLAITWHLGAPSILIVAILVRGSGEQTSAWQGSPRIAIVVSIALVTAIVCGLAWLFITQDQNLPWVYVFHVPGHDNRVFYVPMIALNVVALALLWARGKSLLDLWLMVMCCAWLFEIGLAFVFARSRYALGWYTGRVFEMLAAFTVLVLYLSEKTALYANLARATVERRGARHVRQIAMDVMAASIGHEIKQPLTAVLVNTDVAMRLLKKPEPDLKEVIATLEDVGQQGRLIKDIIGGVRTMFGESDHDRQLLDINKVVQEALDTLKHDLHRQRVSVRKDLAGDLPPVLGDRGQLHQVFLNLITNALEAMSTVADRPAVLRVTSGNVPHSSDIAVTVEDTGVGMVPGEGRRIFEPFFSTKTTGTGVGLTICEVILKAHGGSLEVAANVPHGTILRVILPAGVDE